MLTPHEKETALKVLRVLQSDKYKDKNYLFLLPFDVSQTPGYLQVVEKMLDLQTVTTQVQTDQYASLADAWKETSLIFENAITYHTSKLSQTKWIAKVAKDMLKAFTKERKNAEGGGGGGGGTTKKAPKIRINKPALPTTQEGGGGGASKQVAAAAAVAAATDLPPGIASSADVPAPATAVPIETTSTTSTTKKPTLKLKLATATTTSMQPPSSKGIKAEAKKVIKAKPTQPKLKLKIGLGRNKTAAASAAASAAAGETKSAASSASSSSTSKANDEAVPAKQTAKPKIKLSLGGAGGSRGKELPKAVSAAQAAAANNKSKSKTSSSTTSEARASITPSTAAAAAAAGGGTTSTTTTTAKAKKTKAQTKKDAKTTTKAPKTTQTKSPPKTQTKKDSFKTTAATNFPQAQAAKVLSGLKRRQNKSINWFLQPVSDKSIVQDYRAKVKHPMDISTMTNKLEKKSYASVSAFALDLRRIFANCLKYNTTIKDSLRPVAVEVMQTAEDLLKVFLGSQSAAAAAGGGGGNGSQQQQQQLSYPPLLYCWKLCVAVLDTLYNLVNPSDGQPTALYFLHPVSFYCGGKFPLDYSEKVKQAMDFSTVTANLLEARYRSVEDFCADCRLVISNCITYYSDREDGRIYMEQANRLNEVLSQQLDQLIRYTKSSRGTADSVKAMAPVLLACPPVPLLLSVLQELRAMPYTDKATRITEPAMEHFEKPVSLASFPDYTQHISEPMDLGTVERNVKAHFYATPEDFEYDMNLVFRNCEVYNSKRNGQHLVAIAKYGARQFKKVFYNKMRAFEDPAFVAAAPTSSNVIVIREPSSAPSSSEKGPPNKKIKLDTISISSIGGGFTKGKSAPRISITAAQVSSAALNAARAKSPGTTPSQKKNSAASLSHQPVNQPIPLHIAIARVKEAFPLRRAHKSLQPWEADCARYFKELMRHPWISAARPKFIFHVPVPTLFPELSEAYALKIRKPMDLTTVECTLLAGNRYAGPEDFVQDISLVFANAVRFNKEGRDIGDPLPCAYYDASVHLLRYSKWLSLELLSQYVDDSSEQVDEGGPDGLPPFSWKLTGGNKKVARLEMEKLVMNEPMEKSLEGDRWTWQEAECEKLLKALRHQTDLRYMTFFIQPNYPADYAAFISKPMDWAKVQKTLKKRQYDKFGDIVADLRLIFSNALKYNARLMGTDTVSGRAYEAAKFMSSKLETAITKLLLSISDRLERERIDHTNAEREIEAAERAEEASIRAAWTKGTGADNSAGKANNNKDSSPLQMSQSSSSLAMPSRPDAVKIRMVARLAMQRRESTDLEIPFFDVFDEQDDGQQVQKVRRALFDKQRQEMGKMRQCASAVGALMYSRLLQRNMAEQWVEQERKKLQAQKDAAAAAAASASASGQPKDNVAAAPSEAAGDGEDKDKKNEPSSSNTNQASTVLSELQRKGRGPLQIKLPPLNNGKRKAKRKRPAFSLDD